MDISTTILSVQSKPTQTGKMIYKVMCGDGVERTVWEAPLANALNSYANSGQAVVIDAVSAPSRDGRFTNHTIKGLGGAAPSVDGLQPQALSITQPLPTVGQIATALAPPAIQPYVPKDNMPADTTTRITKMGCLGYASTLVGQLLQGAGPEALDQAVEMTIETCKKLYTVARSHEAGREPLVKEQDTNGQIVPVAVTPADVAAQVPGVTVGAPVAAPVTDDIRWD